MVNERGNAVCPLGNENWACVFGLGGPGSRLCFRLMALFYTTRFFSGAQ